MNTDLTTTTSSPKHSPPHKTAKKPKVAKAAKTTKATKSQPISDEERRKQWRDLEYAARFISINNDTIEDPFDYYSGASFNKNDFKQILQQAKNPQAKYLQMMIQMNPGPTMKQNSKLQKNVVNLREAWEEMENSGKGGKRRFSQKQKYKSRRW